MKAEWQLDDPADADQGERFVAGPVQVTISQFPDEDVLTVETFTTVEFSSFGDLIPDEILRDSAKTKGQVVAHLIEQARAMNDALGLFIRTCAEDAVLEAAKKWYAQVHPEIIEVDRQAASRALKELLYALRYLKEGK